MLFKVKTILLSVVIIGILAGCTASNTGSTYSRTDMGRIATVMKGKIIAIREVKISGNKELGTATGASLGAIGGSSAGNDSRSNVAGAIVGAVVGGLAGAAIEEDSTKGLASEFIIEQNNGQIIAIVQTNEENLQVGEQVLILRSGKARVIRMKE